MAHIYVAPWEWDTSRTRFPLAHWRPPGDPAMGVLDLRATSQTEQAGGTAGFGLFAYDSPQVGLPISLGQDPQAQVRAVDRSGIETLLGMTGGQLLSTRLDQIAAELFTSHVDASGLTSRKPIRIDSKGRADIYLGSFGAIVQRRGNATVRDASRDVYRVDYQRHLDAGMSDEFLRKFTGSNLLKYYGELSGDAADALMAPAHRLRGYEAPTTTISDDFETDTSANWTADGGSFTIDSGNNGLFESTGSVLTCRYSAATLSGDDHYAEAKVVTLGSSWQGTGVRKAASGTKTMYTALKQGTGSAVVQLFYWASGTPNNINGNISDTFAAGSNDDYQTRVDGSTISFYMEGVSQGSASDSNITGNTVVAIEANNTSLDLESFIAEDLAAGIGADELMAARMLGALQPVQIPVQVIPY